MLAYLARRLLLTMPVLLGVATLVFSLIHLIPGDPAQAMLGEAAPQDDVAATAPAARPRSAALGSTSLSSRAGARRSRHVAAHGHSRSPRQILERLPATFELALAAMLVAIAFADSARHRRGRLARHRQSITRR